MITTQQTLCCIAICVKYKSNDHKEEELHLLREVKSGLKNDENEKKDDENGSSTVFS